MNTRRKSALEQYLEAQAMAISREAEKEAKKKREFVR